MKKRICECDQARATPPWIMEIDEEAGRICEWVATDESLVPVGLGLVCGGEQKKKNSRQPETGGKNRENGGMHATKMAAHCVHSIERKRDGKHETGMEAVVEWG